MAFVPGDYALCLYRMSGVTFALAQTLAWFAQYAGWKRGAI